MRGLDPTEWEILEWATVPDPCNELVECVPDTPEQEAAGLRLIARGLVTAVDCVYDPDDQHAEPTPLGWSLWRLGRDVVVGKAVPE